MTESVENAIAAIEKSVDDFRATPLTEMLAIQNLAAAIKAGKVEITVRRDVPLHEFVQLQNSVEVIRDAP